MSSIEWHCLGFYCTARKQTNALPISDIPNHKCQFCDCLFSESARFLFLSVKNCDSLQVVVLCQPHQPHPVATPLALQENFLQTKCNNCFSEKLYGRPILFEIRKHRKRRYFSKYSFLKVYTFENFLRVICHPSSLFLVVV